MDRGAWWATVHWVAKSQTQLSDQFFTFIAINSVVIVSGGQQRDSAIHIIYMYPFCPTLPSHPGCHVTLSRVPCAIQQDLVSYPSQTEQCAHIDPKLLNYLFPLATVSLLMNLFCAQVFDHNLDYFLTEDCPRSTPTAPPQNRIAGSNGGNFQKVLERSCQIL